MDNLWIKEGEIEPTYLSHFRNNYAVSVVFMQHKCTRTCDKRYAATHIRMNHCPRNLLAIRCEFC